MTSQEKQIDVFEATQIENLDLKQQLLAANKKILQLELQKVQNEQENLTKSVSEYFENLSKKYDIDKEGYYIFKITSHGTELEEYMTRNPNLGEIIK